VVTSTPTANNVMVMAELAGDSKQLAQCILLQYLISPLVLPLWLSLFVVVAVSH
jgi:predicted permease